MSSVKIVFGASGPLWCESNDDQANDVMNLLDELGITTFDSARLYGPSEELIGKRKAGARFTINSKHPGGFSPDGTSFVSGGASRESVFKISKISFELLQLDQVDVYYLHMPDPTTPIAETLEALNELHKQGRFNRLGLSNFSADQVDEAVRVAKEKGFVAPSVYQGNYSAVWRKQDTQLFPTLRKHNMSFHAYSPLGGGFLAKTRAQLLEGREGRFVAGVNLWQDMYVQMFIRPHYLDFADKWDAISKDNGIPKVELALRWMAYHSQLEGKYDDAIVIGASSLNQLRNSVEGAKKGPLPDAVVKQIDDAWESIKEAALSEK